MSRQARRAQRRVKKLAREEALKNSPPSPATPVNWDNVRARFANLKGRAVKVGYVPIGPMVEARSPTELEANTAIALAGSSDPAN